MTADYFMPSEVARLVLGEYTSSNFTAIGEVKDVPQIDHLKFEFVVESALLTVVPPSAVPNNVCSGLPVPLLWN